MDITSSTSNPSILKPLIHCTALPKLDVSNHDFLSFPNINQTKPQYKPKTESKHPFYPLYRYWAGITRIYWSVPESLWVIKVVLLAIKCVVSRYIVMLNVQCPGILLLLSMAVCVQTCTVECETVIWSGVCVSVSSPLSIDM